MPNFRHVSNTSGRGLLSLDKASFGPSGKTKILHWCPWSFLIAYTPFTFRFNKVSISNLKKQAPIIWGLEGARKELLWWEVTPDMWHLTCDTWHATCDVLHKTRDTWQLRHDTWHIIIFLSILFFYVSVRFGINATIRTRQEIQCLSCEGLYKQKQMNTAKEKFMSTKKVSHL